MHATVGYKLADRDLIKEFILHNFLFTDDTNAIADDASLIEQGVIDSTGILELVMFIDESLCIKVADSELTPINFDSINAIASFVARKRQS